jgi:nucleotide-binding universal stress UspA family protein
MSLSIPRILHPTDFTEESKRAFIMACGIARNNSAEILVVYVIPATDFRGRGLNSGEIDHDSEQFDELWAKFIILQSYSKNVPVTFKIRVGSTAECIAAIVQEECCDLIVMAAHSHCHLHRQYLGSVSERLMKIVKCPVLCFRRKSREYRSCSRRLELGSDLIAYTRLRRPSEMRNASFFY